VLITGGSGFVGANLVRAELAAGHEVHLLLREEARLWRLTDLAGQYIAHHGDLASAADVRRIVEAARPQIIYHLAAHGAYPSQKDRAAILATNLAGTVNLLEALAGRDYQALVHTGSSSEYGHKDTPMRESDVLEPRTDYAITKAAATLFCQAEAYRGAPVCTVRVFSAYGPWEEPTRLVPYVLASCLSGQPARVTAGQQPRDFIHVEDVVALIRLAASQPRCQGKILHAGTGVQSTVRGMIDVIHEVCGGPAPIFGAEQIRPDEPRHWCASIAATAELTGWKPVHDLGSGIRQMKQWWLDCQARRAA
jgi:nucleoside-diphosphate-sugar epimerase